VRPEGLSKFKKSPHPVSNPRPSGLQHSDLTTMLPRTSTKQTRQHCVQQPTKGTRSLYLCPPMRGWSSYTPFHHLLQPGELLWRYTNPPARADIAHDIVELSYKTEGLNCKCRCSKSISHPRLLFARPVNYLCAPQHPAAPHASLVPLPPPPRLIFRRFTQKAIKAYILFQHVP
jgi:hypothetical protein